MMDFSQQPSLRALLLCSLLCFAGVLSARAEAETKGQKVSPITTTRLSDGNRWALVVGINDYANVPSLRCARNDAEKLAQVLVEDCGFLRDNVILMTDAVDGRSALFPTRGNLRARINQIAQIAKDGDVLVISYSGHGINIDGRGFLIPFDGAGNDVGSCIPLSWVRTTLDTSAASSRLLILDACHAGARDDSANSSPAEVILSPLEGAGFVTLAACDSKQLSHEDPSTGHGVFSHSLVLGLKGQADQNAEGNRDGIITANELFSYASLKVSQWSLRSGKTQTPVLKGEFRGRIELAHITGEGSSRVSRPVLPVRPAQQGRGFSVNLAQGEAISMIWVAGGSFTMGANDSDEDARPAHEMSVKGFWISRTEITQAQWAAVMGQHDSTRKGATLPVDRVTWEEANTFCSKVTERGQKTVSLPSEAEWEYACRAGTLGRFSFDGGLKLLPEHAWFRSNAARKPHPVGELKPNKLGVHDMLGNVWEWCDDWYDAYPGASRPNKFMGKSLRVLRGGCYQNDSRMLSSPGRSGAPPDERDSGVGFRIVCR